jgi:site-specific DNA recombinase
MNKAIGYIRVSTQQQAEEGVSLEAQKVKIEAWCIASDYELTNVYCDSGISGTRSDRPELLAALEHTTKDTALVCYSLSRLSRSTKDMLQLSEELNSKGANLVSLTEKIDTTTAAGKMLFRMLAVLNEFERDQIAERTKSALGHKKASGEVYGHTPFGYQRNGNKLVKDVGESKVIALIQRKRKQGCSIRAIVRELNGQGIKPKIAEKWNPSSVHYLLKRAA